MFQTPELDIAKEIFELLNTDKDCTPLRKPFIHKAIRMVNGERVRCPSCNAGVNGIKEGSLSCPYCKGMGFLWDETIQDGWFFKPNLRTASRAYNYPQEVGRDIEKRGQLLTLPDVFINEGDEIYEVKVDSNKRISIPIIIHQKYSCFFSERFASDQSDSEFNIAGLNI